MPSGRASTYQELFGNRSRRGAEDGPPGVDNIGGGGTGQTETDRRRTQGIALAWRGGGFLFRGKPLRHRVHLRNWQQLLLLTGQRRDEVAEMRWSEIDLVSRLWVIPRERAKNDAAHEVPLSDATITFLQSIPKVGLRPSYVFTTNGERHVTGFSRAKTRLDTHMREAAPTTDPSMVDWRFHDLRRTAASGMARLGINLPVIEKVLNHTSGSFAGVVGVYQRHSFADEKRSALEAWARLLSEMTMAQPDSNVVRLRC